ncbi:transposable element Tcb2 transposase [Trichonephila clavipes]|nr:transposable element Tcb2 transposase [Trichonephila clavipes]
MTPQLAQRTLLIPYHTSVRTLNHDRFNAYIKHGGFKEALGIKPMPLEQWLRFHNFRPSAPSTSIHQNANTKSTVSGINIKPKPLCPEDVLGRSRAITPAGDRFIALSARRRRKISVPQLVADHSVASGRRISTSTVRRRLHNSGLYARRDESRLTLESDSGRLLIRRERNTRFHQSNTVERQLPRWWNNGLGRISLGDDTDLHVFQGGTLTGVRYRYEILDPYV